MFRGNLQGFNSEEKGVDLQQKLDDFSSYSVIRDIMRICSNKCQNSSSLQECLQQCLQVLSFYSLELSEPRSQISEKLAASTKSLYDESEKLLLIVDEIHNQDPMYF
ncbi:MULTISPECIES: hypothetical protein [unclassified Wolbachia]|uniref:hypothetical protein n=1 Tax=unclassified Wolbachia TaxID=2640676 RepID=UPI0022272746|nr:hypothetical protein [Wolbachia endosymbiont (group B) of Episyrphus balteatus]